MADPLEALGAALFCLGLALSIPAILVAGNIAVALWWPHHPRRDRVRLLVLLAWLILLVILWLWLLPDWLKHQVHMLAAI